MPCHRSRPIPKTEERDNTRTQQNTIDRETTKPHRHRSTSTSPLIKGKRRRRKDAVSPSAVTCSSSLPIQPTQAHRSGRSDHTGHSSAAPSSLGSPFLGAAASGPAGATTLARQSGQVAWRRSQASTQAAWNRWPQRGRRRASSPSRNSTMHTAQSPSLSAASRLESNTETGREDAMSSRRRLEDEDARGEVAGDVSAEDDSPSPGEEGPRFPEKKRQK
ncbi:hypothetical protein BRADI_2g27936v3 [Brachypodium distachyon]|uniref:Uncharacterized protein n=1 Tax=Brachypodium distachyon TaxID=15368 RepID=A0A2K2DB02_BRADI|nr:hypothetical protein BRADI_2g27936v3 [Brachypodium distachyon]